MKRYLSILLATVTIFTVSCRKDNTKDNENKDTKASPTMTVTETTKPTAEVQPSETPEATADATKSPEPQGGEVLTETIAAEATSSLAPTPSADATEATATPSATQAVVTSNPTLVPSVNPTQTVAPTAKPTVKPTAAPKTTAPTVKPTVKPTQTVKPTAKPTATVKPTAKPTPTPTAKPTITPYDDAKAQYWVDFATDYALSIGLEVADFEEVARYDLDLFNIELGEEHIQHWSSGTTTIRIYYTLEDVVRENSSWDTPIVVCAKMNQSYIPEAIISRLSYYKEVGNDSVCIWYEKYDSEFAPTADSYEIYIAYGY